jgi:ribokinase
MASPPVSVLVIGNCTLDIAFRVVRFPKPGETVLADEPTEDAGGKGANQAVAAARLGASVQLCAAVGLDQAGRMIRGRLQDEGVGLEYLRDVPSATDRSIILVAPGGDNLIVSTHAAAESLQWADIERSLRDLQPPLVLMQGNLERGATEAALRLARTLGAFTVLNPSPIRYEFASMWPLVHYVVVNRIELKQLTGCPGVTSGARFLLQQGVGHVLVTLGAAGALLGSRRRFRRFAAERVQAVDTTGAGDVFCGVLAASLALGDSLEVATQLAVRAATLSVTRSGTQAAFPTRAEMARLVAECRVS